MSLRNSLASNLKREMSVRHWTQAELARLCGVSQPRIAELLKAKHSATLDTVDKIATVFGLPASALLLPVSENSEIAVLTD